MPHSIAKIVAGDEVGAACVSTSPPGSCVQWCICVEDGVGFRKGLPWSRSGFAPHMLRFIHQFDTFYYSGKEGETFKLQRKGTNRSCEVFLILSCPSALALNQFSLCGATARRITVTSDVYQLVSSSFRLQ